MRTDPTDNGGLFIGRRPGTAPVKYRALPQRGSASRQRIDRLLAAAILGLMALISALYWGPIPAGSLWVASQVQFRTDNLGVGLLVGFAVLLAVLFGGLMVLKRLDQLWILVRRAAGIDQRDGVIGRVFGITAAIGATLFIGWLLLIAGPGASLAPTG
ncbi:MULTISPECIES: hypothetical protein [Solirubrobacterales]|uniref:hypothetical protein n=1 Tax=Solirubrobacterales TaxID=588673 RepID=UPI001304F841|nr:MULTISPECIES: hypothetical protein [Solirubrobacterales]